MIREIRGDQRVALLVFATLLFSYAYFFGGSGFNQNATFDLSRSLVERQRLDIDPYVSNTADVSRYNGHYYPNKAPGLSFLAAIPYAFLYEIAGAPANALTLNLYLYFCTIAVCGVSGALIGVLLYYGSRRAGASAAASVATALVLGLGTPLFSYSTMLFAHVPSALFVLVAFMLVRRRPLFAGASIGLATTINYLCAPLALLFWFPAWRDPRGRMLYIVGGLPFALLLGAYHYAAFGSPFRTSIDTMNPAFRDSGALLGIFRLPSLEALWGITFSPFRGLFYLSPVLLLALPGLRRQWLIAIAALYFLIANASFNGWHGGYTVGPRYLLPIVPLLALTLLRTRFVWPVLAAISIVANLAVTAVDPQPPDTLRDPLGDYAIPALVTGRASNAAPVWIRELYTGHTSTNRVAADEILPFKRHQPGSAESEWASFNLGEFLFGPGSAASLLPFLLIVSMLALVAYRTAHTIDSLRPETRDSSPEHV